MDEGGADHEQDTEGRGEEQRLFGLVCTLMRREIGVMTRASKRAAMTDPPEEGKDEVIEATLASDTDLLPDDGGKGIVTKTTDTVGHGDPTTVAAEHRPVDKKLRRTPTDREMTETIIQQLTPSTRDIAKSLNEEP